MVDDIVPIAKESKFASEAESTGSKGMSKCWKNS